MSKIAFITLGCKVNQYETNAMSQKFVENGDQIVENTEVADIYIINTCTVTNVSDKKSRQMLRRVKELNKKAMVVAVGCYAQVGKEELEKIEEIDLVLGNNEKKDIVEIVKVNEGNCISNVMKKEEYIDFGSVTYTEKTRAVIKVQDGCDRFCSYCIIPYARGNIKSRSKESILDEIEANVKKGIKEIVITGIHIASYGKDAKNGYYLIDLIEDVEKIEGLKRIRLGSLEPLLITDEFVERLSKIEKICLHFHLSIQSGCDSVLDRMNRRYKTKDIEEICKRLREKFDDVVLTTDIIVGFPGETQEEFSKTYAFLKNIELYKMHIFKYSPRKGTPASKMLNQIDNIEKESRSKQLLAMSDENQCKYNKTLIGKEVEVLFEENKDGIWQGHTKNFILAKIEIDKKLQNKIKKATCIKTDDAKNIEITLET